MGNAWHRMSPQQKEDFMATVVMALYEQDILNENEADDARHFFSIDGDDEISTGVSKVFEAIDKGIVRFAVHDDVIAIYFPNNVERLMMLLSELSPMEQFDKMNEVVQELKDAGHITNEEADEAFTDILKLFTFRSYMHHSRGTRKVMASLHKVLDKKEDS